MKKKINIIIAAIDAVLAAAMAAALIYADSAVDEVSLSGAAESWAGVNSETPYAAVSLYTSENTAKSLGDIYRIRADIRSKTYEQLADTDESAFSDCWYGTKSLTLTGKKGTAEIMGFYTGGDYFSVHRADVISGSPYDSETVNLDTIVLDDETAWKLFGSLNVAGMTVETNNTELYISAVIRSPQKKSKHLKAAYDDDGISAAYLPAEAANLIYGEEQQFTAYDVLMPDPIDNFAEGIVRDAAGLSQGDSSYSKVIDSRSRFSLKKIRESAEKISIVTDSSSELVYPFYEDAARSVMLDLTVLYKVFFPVFVLLMISVCYWIVAFVKLLRKGVLGIYGIICRKADDKKLENYYKTHPKIIIKEPDEGDLK